MLKEEIKALEQEKSNSRGEESSTVKIGLASSFKDI